MLVLLSMSMVSVMDELKKTNILNCYFAAVSVSNNDVTPQCNEVVLESVLDTVHICETDALRSINKLKCNMNCGPDEVPPVLIKHLKHCLCKPLSIMFSQLVSVGIVLDLT